MTTQQEQWMEQASEPAVARVARGAALLDSKGPHGWRYALIRDPGPLDMWTDCVLDRAYGSFSVAIVELDLSSYQISALGFCPNEDGNDDASLAHAWMAEAGRTQS